MFALSLVYGVSIGPPVMDAPIFMGLHVNVVVCFVVVQRHLIYNEKKDVVKPQQNKQQHLTRYMQVATL